MRPIGTALLALGIALAGIVAYFHLPIAPLPRTDIPTIFVGGGLPGADPETTAAAVVGPLERRLGAISGITEMTSYSTLGAYFIVLQFDLDRKIDDAARDVEQAINAAGTDLPPLPNPPYVRRVNPGDAPVLIMAMTSATASPGAVYDAADSIVSPRIAQVPGVSSVSIQGAEQPAIRVAVDPAAAKAAGVSMEQIRQAISQNNVTQATGLVDGTDQMAAIHVNDRLTTPRQFGDIIVRSQNGAVVRLSSIARVKLDARDRRQGGSVDGQPAVMMTIFKQADANVIDVVNGIRELMPQLERWLPGGVEIRTIRDRTETIRASVAEVEHTLLVAIALVIMVVAVFLRRVSAISATAAAVPLSLLGTLAVMWLLGYSLDNLSLMALTISVGFVVDDAIVMIENMTRLRERGMGAMDAAIEGARQIGFTVVSITVSLIAVFIPLLFMGGLIGRMFREFSVVLALAVGISGVVSLTLTPMMAARMTRRAPPPPGRFGRAVDRGMAALTNGYLWTLRPVLRWRRVALIPTLGLIGVTVWLYMIIPKSFFPDQDTGLIIATTRAAPDTSYQRMLQLQDRVLEVIRKDPAVASVASAIGAGNGNASVSQGRVFLSLKPLKDRPGVSAEDVINRLRRPLGAVAGVQTFMRAVQDIGIGGRAGNASIQFVLLSPEIGDLQTWSNILVEKLRTLPQIQDVNSDQQNAGPVARLVIDREAAARTGVSVAAITSALNSSFSQRQVSVIYRSRNQYRVVLELEPGLQQYPEQVDDIWLSGSGGVQVPLSALVRMERGAAPLFVTKQSQLPASTITFNLSPGVALSEATAAVERASMEVGLPDTMRTEFAGNARAFQSFTRGQPLLILASIIVIYIVLGILYEHVWHPLTILSTLPTAGIGALLALLATKTPFSVIALIAVILLMGIVKKNAIMMVDFALEHERNGGRGGLEAILEACRERFRPILMTTLAAVFGAVPLALSTGPGAELRQPLGIALIGGLLLAQVLTLYTTPVVYLALDGLGRKKEARVPAAAPAE
nr:efflux RND transporter permease subunit [Paracraurococcus ruber]